MTVAWAFLAARCSGVAPSRERARLTLAPAVSSTLAASMWPLTAALCRGVEPSLLVELGLQQEKQVGWGGVGSLEVALLQRSSLRNAVYSKETSGDRNYYRAGHLLLPVQCALSAGHFGTACISRSS